MKNKKTKAYSTPEGLLYSASSSFANASLAWIANMIWQLILLFIRAQGILSLVLSLVGFGFLLYGAILCYIAFESEIQADAILHEKTDRLLRFAKKGVMACIIVRTILAIAAMLLGFLLTSAQDASVAVVLEGWINMIGDVFTTINILGIFAYKVFLREGDQPKIKIFSLLSLLFIAANLILSLLANILQIGGFRSNLLSYTSLFVTVVGYCCLYLLFEARKAFYRAQIKE